MKSEVVILGAGITGLSAGIELGDQAIILEKSDRPGGLVKTFNFNGYWFDNVVHLLHFRNQGTESFIKNICGDMLKLCAPEGWVETKEGTTRYPLQLNLGGLNKRSAINCKNDFVQREVNPNPSSYKEFLLSTFGKAMCDLFFFPYNEKLWKYPLDDMTSSGQVWNIHQPSLWDILRGIAKPNRIRNSYNSNGYYPQTLIEDKQRGMELLSQKLASGVKTIIYNQEVQLIKDHCVFTWDNQYDYVNCLSTIPLPDLMRICLAPNELMNEVSKLKWVKVISIGLSVKGKRDDSFGHWHYYADPEVPFTKVIYMTNFDRYNAPEEGFGLLIEIPVSNIEISKVIADLRKLKVLKAKDRIIDINSWEVNPAYVIFTKETPGIVAKCKEYLQDLGITTIGRYGNWEYSSMAENIKDGLNYAKNLLIT